MCRSYESRAGTLGLLWQGRAEQLVCGSGWQRPAGGPSGDHKPRVRSYKHAASQGFDPGAQPSQHWRRPEHPVSLQGESERRTLEWGGVRLSARGTGKYCQAGKLRQRQETAGGAGFEGPSSKGKPVLRAYSRKQPNPYFLEAPVVGVGIGTWTFCSSS